MISVSLIFCEDDPLMRSLKMKGGSLDHIDGWGCLQSVLVNSIKGSLGRGLYI